MCDVENAEWVFEKADLIGLIMKRMLQFGVATNRITAKGKWTIGKTNLYNLIEFCNGNFLF